MIRLFVRLFACVWTAIALVVPAAAFEIERHKSPEGTEFVYVHMPKVTQTYIRFVWKGGNGFVPRGKENIEELGPVLLINGGSGDLSPDELAAQVMSLEGGVQIYSDTDATHGILNGTEGNLVETAALFNKVLVEPRFDPRWLRRIQRHYAENISLDALTPIGQAWRTMREVTVKDHPLKQVWNATPVDRLQSITRDDIVAWHKRVFSRKGLTLFVAGNAGVKDVGAAIDVALRGLPETSGRQDFTPLTMRYTGKTILVHRPDVQKSFILVGGPMPKTYSADQEAREIGIGVLGVSDQSRLFTAIRKELRAAYGFEAWGTDFSRAHNMIYLQGEVETAKLQDALETIEVTYEDFRTGGIGPVEFPFAKRLYRNRALGIAESPQGAANLMVEAWITGRDIGHGLAYPMRASDLTRGDVNMVIARDFPPFSQKVKVVVSPDRDALVADCIISDYTEAGQCE